MAFYRCGSGGGSVGPLYPLMYDGIQSGGQVTINSPVLNGSGRLLVFPIGPSDNRTVPLVTASGTVTLSSETITFRTWNYANVCLNTISYSNASDAVVQLQNIGGRCGIAMMDIGTSTPIITGNTAGASNHTPVDGSGTIYWFTSFNNNDYAGSNLSVKYGSGKVCFGQMTGGASGRSLIVVARYEKAVSAQFTASQVHSMVIVPD